MQDNRNEYLLIELKRPSHSISRDDIAQAEKYRDDLYPILASGSRLDIMLIGKGRTVTLGQRSLPEGISIHSYAAVISAAFQEVDWLINSLSVDD